MEKTKADGIIAKYLKKIYGFAYKKSYTHDEEGELASEMVAEVYQSLLSAEEVCNVEGYVWRICEHTYAKYVASVKRRYGVSLDDAPEQAYNEHFADVDEEDGETRKLRREIAYLSAQRREIIFRFYYKNESVGRIATRLQLSEGTVKWHLNKARNELKEGLQMERKTGNLGINPVTATGLGHSGFVGPNGGPLYYLGDKLNLNIVYSVYFAPKTMREIADELGVTPVFIEDKVALLENNGYLVRMKGGKYTTYVRFSLRTSSKERDDVYLRTQYDLAKILVAEYVPLVRKAVAETEDVYIPGGNRELFEAAVIFFAVTNMCHVSTVRQSLDLSRYTIKDLDGGEYVACIDLQKECTDPEYQPRFTADYACCGDMWRESRKYPGVGSWSMDTRFDSRVGTWKNNLTEDYEYLYEYMTGKLTDENVDGAKLNRLKERAFIGEDGKVQITVLKAGADFMYSLPKLDEALKERFAKSGLEQAMQTAGQYPPQMQDLILAWSSDIVDQTTSMMVLDILYADGTFKPLTDREKITANLIMFSDVLPV